MTDPISSIQESAYFKIESTFDTNIAFLATDAVKVLELNIEPDKQFHRLQEHAGSQSVQGYVEGKIFGTWSAKFYVNVDPTEAVDFTNTPRPSCHALLKAAFGTETEAAGTSDTFSLDAASVDVQTLQIGELFGTDLYRVINGCTVERVELEIPPDGQIPTIAFSGSFADLGFAFPGTVNGAQAQSQTEIEVASGTAGRYRAGARVKFASDDNSGAGFLITAVNYTADSFTISPGVQDAGGLSDAEAITPFEIAGTPNPDSVALGAIACDFTADGTSLEFNTAKLTFETGHKLLNRTATSAKATRTTKGLRLFTGEVETYALLENAHSLEGHAYQSTFRSLVFRVGADTSGARLKWNLPSARFKAVPLDVSEEDVVTRVSAFEAKYSSSQNDECTVVFD